MVENKLKEGWRKIKLLDYYEVTNGLSKNKSEFGFGYPFLTFKEVFNNYFLPENLVNLANSTVKEREKCSIKRGDIFITRTSETMEELGITAVALKDYPNATFNGFTKRLRPKSHAEISPEFISFYLKSKEFRNQIQSFSTLTTRASLNNEMLEKLELIIPGIQKQKEIAKILKNLYDKIEINNEMNKTLEEMAQTLFKRWFIDFDFPNENGEPYKSSDGKMIDSELGEIPEGWEVGLIKDIGEVITGKTPSTKNKENYGGKIPFITIPDMHGNIFITNTQRYLSEIGNNVQNKKLLPVNSIIVSCIATVGLVSLNIKPSHTNQQINSIVPKSQNTLFYFFNVIKTLENKLKMIGSAGTTTLNVNKSAFENIKIVFPNLKLMETYNNFVKNMYLKIKENHQEIQSLTEIRDILLPKLMSGEIEV